MTDHPETFEQFKQSFWYGSRSDLHFKFLASLPDEDAAEFFRQLLEALGDAFDTDDHAPVRDLVFAWQARAYDKPPKFRYDDGPFTVLAKPLADTTVALVSAGGVYLPSDDPANGETQAQAEARIDDYLREPPVLVEIPRDVAPAQVCVRHPGYDVRGARRDLNSVFPIDVLGELQASGAGTAGPPRLRVRRCLLPAATAQDDRAGLGGAYGRGRGRRLPACRYLTGLPRVGRARRASHRSRGHSHCGGRHSRLPPRRRGHDPAADHRHPTSYGPDCRASRSTGAPAPSRRGRVEAPGVRVVRRRAR